MSAVQSFQVALVTGAQRGIGRAIALELARNRIHVALVDTSVSAELLAVVKEVEAMGIRAAPFAADVAAIEAHESVLDNVETILGPLNCLVNNAGVGVLTRGDLLDVTPQSYDRCLDINTRGTFFLTQAFARRLIDRPPTANVHRSVITVTSSNATAVSIARVEYCVSKAALSMTSRLFAVRLAPYNIGVYEIQPGFIETEMTAPVKARYDALIENGITAMPRWGTPDDVARVAATLARGELPYTVGQPIQVDGGLLIAKY